MKNCLTSLLLLAALFLLCAEPPAAALMLIPKSVEIVVGKMVHDDLLAQLGGVTSDRKLTDKVTAIGARLAAVSPRKDISYTYEVANSGIINAFSCPGGPIVITSGLASRLTDDELAFVLGHETGHEAAQHARKELNTALLAGVIGKQFKGVDINVSDLASIAYSLITLGYSRKDEYQADDYGEIFAEKAGFKREACITALGKLGLTRLYGDDKYLSTHPDTPSRILRLAKKLGLSKAEAEKLLGERSLGPE